MFGMLLNPMCDTTVTEIENHLFIPDIVRSTSATVLT